MAEFFTSELFYAPQYKTVCVSLNAQAAKVPRGTIICAKGDAVSATFTGTEAALTGDAQNYTPAGSVAISSSAGADGTFDVIGTAGYGAPYGVLLNDAGVNASAQPVDLIVFGSLFKSYVNGVYKAATTNDLPESVVAALRSNGIFLK